MNKPVLVLDLDNTLVFSHRNTHIPFDFRIQLGGDEDEPLSVMKRPGLDTFLAKMAMAYQLIVFSAAESTYVNAVVDKMDCNHTLISRTMHRGDCDVHGDFHVKNLKKLFLRDLRRVVWIDDNKDYFQNNQDNGFQVFKFEGSQDDSLFTQLSPFLLALAQLNDFRPAISLWKRGELKVDKGLILIRSSFDDEWIPLDMAFS